jgi:hypothetical protein
VFVDPAGETTLVPTDLDAEELRAALRDAFG